MSPHDEVPAADVPATDAPPPGIPPPGIPAADVPAADVLPGHTPGPDLPAALIRPAWAEGSDLLRHYYDTEWGMPVRDEAGLLERICLEGFQAGLSWELILRRRPAFRAAFADFDPDTVAAFGPADVERLMADPSIVGNARKIEATIGNARATVELRSEGGLADLVWSFLPSETIAPRTVEEIPSTSPEADALAKELRRCGFRFVGPTTMYALMQAIGMVDAHIVGSPRRGSSGVWPT